MDDQGVLPRDRSKRLYVVGRAIAVCLGILSGSISLAFGVHRLLPVLVDYGAAISVSEVLPIGIYRHGGKLGLAFDKRRACDPKSATVTVTDERGETYVGSIEWVAPFPVRSNISASMSLKFPAHIPPGYYRNAIAEIWHWRCTDGGGDPRQPVTIKIPNFLVSE